MSTAATANTALTPRRTIIVPERLNGGGVIICIGTLACSVPAGSLSMNGCVMVHREVVIAQPMVQMIL